MATKKADVNELIGAIESLTVLELAELVEQLKEKFGVSAMAAMPAAAPASNGEAEEAEQTEFDVVLSEIGPNKIPVIKVVRQITGLGLKESKAMVDEAPNAIKEAVSRDEAEEIAKLLQAEGATVDIK
ncbi:MAG: 50S ribosomal protein L7/L12 [Chloroflexi bacterium]|nr:50S ribosomal protein L7/L12 [Chloroflexota bacterium]MDE2703213.1 50S ribosomal protein L7/L12 [Chloroflexota bacterium]MDE2936506.1 50S ribosomal protein L7/L12 [Chloroflexota bacterium]MXW29161.1 50S ribosomal protein L7/L12 [Chloroflexota bacterium]MXX66466.1 50S ribosomal protein L7/L12 [Chloroflexota bacterium]